MFLNNRRATATALVLGLTAAFTFQASAQDEMMQGEPAVAADYGKGCCEECCSSGGFYGEFQYVRLDSYDTGGLFEDVDSHNGYRVVGGYETCDGLGLRVRYFDFDGVQQDDSDYNYGMDLWYLDVEVTQSFCLCNLNGVVSGGYRHADYKAWFDDELYGNFEGDGITFGLELQRDITCNLGLYAWVQHAIVVGDDEAESDNIIDWTEAQLAAQYSSCVGGYDAFARVGVEAQFHDGVEGGYESGLMGWFLSAGLNY